MDINLSQMVAIFLFLTIQNAHNLINYLNFKGVSYEL